MRNQPLGPSREEIFARRFAQARVSVAARAAPSSFFAFSRMSPLPKTALPATSSSAPARTISPTVSSATPPSISIRKDRASDEDARRLPGARKSNWRRLLQKQEYSCRGFQSSGGNREWRWEGLFAAQLGPAVQS